MEFYIIRHGETNFNKEGRVQGQEIDEKLNEMGREQAKKTGIYLQSHKPFDIIISSPLKRAMETANIIAAVIGYDKANIKYDDRISEGKMGLFAGTTREESDILEEKIPGYKELDKEYNEINDPIVRSKLFLKYDDEKSIISKMEPFSSMMKRSYNFIKELLDKDYKKIMIVSHSGLITAMLMRMFNIMEIPMGEMIPESKNVYICYVIYQNKFIMISPSSNIHLSYINE